MSDEVKKYLNEYADFVTKVTSKPSLESNALKERIDEIDEAKIFSPRLLTAALGLGSETGEFTEIVKKLFLQEVFFFKDGKHLFSLSNGNHLSLHREILSARMCHA